MRLVVFFMFFIAPMISFSQYDTTYVMRFPGRLGVALYQSKPRYEIRIRNKQTDPGAVNELDYQTQANYITGIGLHYDKITLFAGIKTPGESNELKGKTRSSQFAIAFTGVKLRIEASARYYTGFYENNSPFNIPSFTDTSEYYQNSEMKTSTLKLKLFYFFNFKKRFTYGAAYINNTRQLKSAGSLLFTTNLYHFGVKNDGPLVPPYLAHIFEPYDSIDHVKVTGLSAGIGYTHTFIIFKRLFLNLLFAVGIENQTLILSENDVNLFKHKRTVFSSYDFRSSIGYNSNRFYISFHTIVDGNVYTFNDIEMENNFINTIVLVGYRFGVKIPVIDKYGNK